MHPAIANRRNKIGSKKISDLEDAIRSNLNTILEAVENNDVLSSMYGDGIKAAIVAVEASDPDTPEGQEIRKNIAEYINSINAVCRTILEDR